MPLMNAELYDALLEAGATDDKARKAAEAVASFENRFTRIEAELGFHRWAFAAVIGLQIATLTKLFVG